MLNWGIVSTGHIARRVAKILNPKQTQGMARMQAVFSRDIAKAKAFAREFDIPAAYDTLGAMLADPLVEAVYIANPHPAHYETALKAAAAGKQILCEKTLAMNLSQAEQMARAARENNVLLTEAFTYRACPRTRQLRELLQSGAIGQPVHLECAFFAQNENAPARLTEKNLGGGAMLDLGCYTLSMARMVAGVAEDKPFSEPEILAAHARFVPNGIDEHTGALLRFPCGMSASIACGVHAQYTAKLSVVGSTGRIEIEEPWQEKSIMRLIKGKEQHAQIFDSAQPDRFADLIAQMARCVEAGKIELPEMTPEDSLGNVAALDAWRAKIGLRYPEDDI